MNTVLITGVYTGIGRACVCLLDEKGYQVFAGVRRQKDADSITVQCSSRVKPIQLDVTKTEEIIEARRIVEASLNGMRMTDEMKDLYGQPLLAMREFIANTEMKAIEPLAMALAVYHAVASPRPRIRYPVGTDAKMGLTLRRFMPDRMFDWLARKRG